MNIGAGTITCNYDGVRKHQTVIGKNVFLGSDTQLVAPVTIGEGAVVAAGTTVTQDVPADALAIGRATQENRVGWAAKRRLMLARSAAAGQQRVSGQPQSVQPAVRSKKKHR